MSTSRRTSSITYLGCAAAVIAAVNYSCNVALAFSPTFVVLSSGRTVPSRLFAGGEGGEETAQQHPPAAALPSEKETDILNSPTFLKRKLEVLKSDIAKMDEKISKVKADLEAGKAQWEGKFKELEREVSILVTKIFFISAEEDESVF